MSKTVQSIQFLRFLAASFVVIFHSNLALNKYDLHESSVTELRFFYAGGSGVDIFFVISGFIMIYTSHSFFGNKNYIKYFTYNRLVRIYPIYWLYCLFYLAFHIWFFEGFGLSGSEILNSLLLLPGYAAMIIGPGWTLPYELFFYFVFAISLLLSLKHALFFILLAFSVLFILGVVFSFESPILHVITNIHLFEFFIGVMIGLYFLKGPKINQYVLIFASLCSLGVIFLVPLWGAVPLPTTVRWGIPASILVFSVAMLDRDFSLSRLVGATVPLGNSSYSLYLLHILIIDILIMLMIYFDIKYQHDYRALVLLIIYFTCVVVSHFCYAKIEVKMLKLARRRVGPPLRSGV